MRMCILKMVLLVGVLAPGGLLAAENQPLTMDQVVDRIITREHTLVASLRPYSPLVETYVQNTRSDKELGKVPAGDSYFLGRADLSHGLELHALTGKTSSRHRVPSGFGGLVSMQYQPLGFLRLIYIDTDGFDRQHHHFEYVRREFLGEVRCLVFDVTPLANSGKGLFIGRIWVEDQNYTIVRFNGAYTPQSRSKFYFHFDSWRVNAGPGLWVPAYIYSEESDFPYALSKHLRFKAQTRLWGYDLGPAGREQELSRILVEAATPVRDKTDTAKGLSAIQAQRAWDRQAEDNVVERLERIGLLAPSGEVDKVLETVVNNLEVTNNLDIQPEVRCRVLLTTTLESFTLGHTLVLSRGLIDVLPDEATLATMLAHELAHVALGHRIDTQYAFNDSMLFKDEETLQHFVFRRDQSEEDAANQKAMELLKNSPYKSSLANASLFLQALDARSKQVPNLISPNLGDRIPVNSELRNLAAQADSNPGNRVVALPLGGRVNLDPWGDNLEMIKSKPAGTISEREKMPFEVTPFMPYLTRQNSTPASQAISAPLLFPGLSAPLQVQGVHLFTDGQAREAAEQAVSKADSSPSNRPLSIRRREDLEEFLLTVEEKKPARNVYFYEIQSPSRTAFGAYSVWVVAVAGPTRREVYELYGFEPSKGSNGSLQEFDRLISQLAIAIPEKKATSFARFFLGACVGGEPQEIVLDEDGLRHAVERYYFGTYGEIWRALEAYVQWWEDFQTNALAFAPTIRLENGRYRVVLRRLLTLLGRHPQVQEWDLEISRDGKVRVLAMQPIFPKQPGWLFYDSP